MLELLKKQKEDAPRKENIWGTVLASNGGRYR
jgi:hypothetical protein